VKIIYVLNLTQILTCAKAKQIH